MKKLVKNKKNILKFVIFIIMIYLFIYLGTKNYMSDVSDNVRFANEYKDISKNNVYKYVGENEILDVLNGKSAIIFMGFSSNIWCHYYADYLNEIALINNVNEIYYYDFKRDRSLNNSGYNNIVKKLKDYLVFDDLGNMDLLAPTVLIVKNGTVLYFDDELREIKGEILPEDYFTDYKKNLLKANFDLAIKKYLDQE